MSSNNAASCHHSDKLVQAQISPVSKVPAMQISDSLNGSLNSIAGILISMLLSIPIPSIISLLVRRIPLKSYLERVNIHWLGLQLVRAYGQPYRCQLEVYPS